MKLVIGILLALAIGAMCRYFDLPAPAPPKLLGACLVAAMTLGYVLADQYLSKHSAQAGPPQVEQQASR